MPRLSDRAAAAAARRAQRRAALSGHQCNWRQVLKRLKRAETRLLRKGWIQGKFWSPAGFCLVGALEARDHIKTDWSVMGGACSVLRACIPIKQGPELSEWNDQKGRTKAQVIALVRKGQQVVGRLIEKERK